VELVTIVADFRCLNLKTFLTSKFASEMQFRGTAFLSFLVLVSTLKLSDF